MENQVKFHGQGKEFFGIWIVNILLSIVTLGIYSAWAKVRTNRYFYGNTEIAGDRLGYHALPKQILVGRIIAVICVVIWTIASNFFPLVSMGLLAAGIALMPWLLRNNARFDARMTSYRNVRFGFTGDLSSAYVVFLALPVLCLAIVGALLVVGGLQFQSSRIGLGMMLIVLSILIGFFAYSWIASKVASYYLNHYTYGNHHFQAEVSWKAFAKTYCQAGLIWFGVSAIVGIIALIAMGDITILVSQGTEKGTGSARVFIIGAYLLLGLTMIIINAFIRTKIRNYLFGQVEFGDSPTYQLASRMTVFGLLNLIITNFVLLVITLGIAKPWVQVRTAAYLAGVTYVIGDLSQLQAEGDDVAQNNAIADEVASAFDLGVGIG
ncbi:hypothetical protein BZJ19_05835 [Salinivibrio proteolyticus]|uniref:YjgN family protein n=1 Tax=Salinivibrio proteolyticus TaxID=334715 RepID=UPI000989353E|nr:YjgN family protein [Salinivibrio proteolyticus]OOF26055.1 hypothetical protein BZJ19_05835 [Salinivibrio proteolyticus]